mgnify:CR=1 FL=1
MILKTWYGSWTMYSPLKENIMIIVNNRGAGVTKLSLGDRTFSNQFLPFILNDAYLVTKPAMNGIHSLNQLTFLVSINLLSISLTSDFIFIYTKIISFCLEDKRVASLAQPVYYSSTFLHELI